MRGFQKVCIYVVGCAGYDIKKRLKAIDDVNLVYRQRDSRFRRWEFWGYESYYILHYTVETILFLQLALDHRNSKNTTKPFKLFNVLHLLMKRDALSILNIHVH